MTEQRRSVARLATAVLSRLVAVVAAFMATAVATRTLTTEAAASYFWLLSAIALVSSVAGLGSFSVVHGLLARARQRGGESAYKNEVRGIFRRVFFASCATTLAGAICGQFLDIQPLTHIGISTAMAGGLVGIAGSCLGLSMLSAEILRFQSRHTAAAFGGAIAAPCTFLFFFSLLIYSGERGGGLFALSTLCAGYALAALASTLSLRRDFAHSSSDYIHGSMGIYWSAVATSVCAFVVTQAHIVVAGLSLPPEASTPFSASSRLAIVITLLPTIIHQTTLPSSIRLYTGGDGFGATLSLRAATTLATILIFPIAVPLLIFPSEVLQMLFGSGYTYPDWTARTLVLATLLNSIRGPAGTVMLSTGLANIQAKLTVAGATVAAALLTTAHYLHSGFWIAVAVLLSVSFQIVLEGVVLWRRNQIATHFSFSLLCQPKILFRALHVR